MQKSLYTLIKNDGISVTILIFSIVTTITEGKYNKKKYINTFC